MYATGFGAYPADNMNDTVNSYFNESDTNFFADNSNDSFFCDSFSDDSSSMGEFFTEAGIGTDPNEKNFAIDKYDRDAIDKYDRTPGVTAGRDDYETAMRQHDEESDMYDPFEQPEKIIPHIDRKEALRRRKYHMPDKHQDDRFTGSDKAYRNKHWNPLSEDLAHEAQGHFDMARYHEGEAKNPHNREHVLRNGETRADYHQREALDQYQRGRETQKDAISKKKREKRIEKAGEQNWK